MYNGIDNCKSLVIGVVTGMAAYLSPLRGEVFSLMSVFAVNFFCGLLAALLAGGERFNFKKAFRCVGEAAVFFVLVCSIYIIGEHHGDKAAALQCVSFITYSVFYFYSVNILRNVKTLLPRGNTGYRVVAFLYYVLSVEFVKRIPYLSEYIGGINPDGRPDGPPGAK